MRSVDKLTDDAMLLQLPDVAQGRKNPLWMGLPGRLHRTRKRTDVSQGQVARRGKIADSVISRTESNQQVPTLESVERIAAGLGVSVCWLAFGHDGDEPFQKKRPRSPLPLDDPDTTPEASRYCERYKGCGERVRQVREQLGLSLRAVADLASKRVRELRLAAPRLVSYQSVLYIETSASVPRLDTIEYIAMALDVAPCWLAFGDEEPLDHVRNLDQVPTSPLDEKAVQNDGK